MIFEALVLGHVRANPLRALVTVVAVALGVAVLVAIALIESAELASFRENLDGLDARVGLQVVGAGRGFDERTFLAVRNVPGVVEARPVVSDTALIRASRGGGESLRFVGVDLLRALPGVSGTRERRPGPFAPDGDPIDTSSAIAGNGAIVSARLAQRFGLHRGSRLDALAGARRTALQIVDVLPADAAGVDSSVVFVDLATAQAMFAKDGLLDRIDCVIDGPLPGVRAALAAVVPPGVRVERPGETLAGLGQLLRDLQLDLTLLAYVVPLAGASLVYGAVGTSVAERRTQIGTLRALGATRFAIFRAFVAEGAAFGVAGGLLGVELGVLAAAAVIGHTETPALVLLRAFALGVMLATLSAVLPALAAARVAPAVALRTHAGAAALPIARFDVARRFEGFSPALRLAAQNLVATLPRIAIALSALALACATTLGFGIASASFRHAVETWAAQTMSADLIVQAAGAANGSGATFAARDVARLASVSGIAYRPDASRSLTVPFRGTTIVLRGQDDVTGAIATAPLAARFGLHPGDSLELQTPRGVLPLKVGAVQEDYADPLGTLIVARSVLAAYYGETGADAVAIALRPDADPIAVREQLERSVLPMRVEIRTTRELRMQSLALFDRTFALANGLGVLSLAIAVAGIATTLGGLVLERRREIGILRYVGATRALVHNMIVSEAALIGLVAVAIGLFAGLWLALVQLVVIDRRIFGWSIPLHVPFALVTAVVCGALAASVVAALYPARIASRIASDVAGAAS